MDKPIQDVRVVSASRRVLLILVALFILPATVNIAGMGIVGVGPMVRRLSGQFSSTIGTERQLLDEMAQIRANHQELRERQEKLIEMLNTILDRLQDAGQPRGNSQPGHD